MLATSTVLRSPPKPGWQTDELEDEWIEPSSSDSDTHDNDDDQSIYQMQSLSIASNGRFQAAALLSPKPSPHSVPPSPSPQGTFLIREDQVAAPILPQPIRKGKSKSLFKDFFSPLALETMFEPPSPRLSQNNLPQVPSPLSKVATNHAHEESDPGDDLKTPRDSIDEGLGEGDMEEETGTVPDRVSSDHGHGGVQEEDEEGEDVILASDIPNLVSFDGRKPSSAYKFTFSAARPANVPGSIREVGPSSPPLPSKQSNTPQPQAPATDPRLRLFHFQYDTFTRDHLSAMVDSIAVHTPSSDPNKTKSLVNLLNRDSHNQHASTPEHSDTYLRATKRLKLTPPEDTSQETLPMAPRTRKDYVGESKHLMKKIKQARTPSMLTTASIKENVQPTNMEDSSTMEDRPRRVPCADVRSMWFSDTASGSSIAHDPNQSPTPSSCLQPSTAHASTSLHPVYPTSTVTPSIPSSLFSSTSNSSYKPSSIASALGYRRQAADLMAQIRKDMTTGKRLVSLDTVKDKTMDEENPEEPGSPVQVRVTQVSPEKTLQMQPSGPPMPSYVFRFPTPSPPTHTDKQRSLPRNVTKPSPRKLLRRLSAADEVDREIAMNKSDASFTAGLQETSHLQSDEQSLDVKYFPEASPSPSPKSISQPLPKPVPQPLSQPSSQAQIVQVFHAIAPTSAFTDARLLLPQAPNTEPTRIVSGGTTISVDTADSALTRGTTATSATSVITSRTVSSGSATSAASFVKHAGPVQITRIKPGDVPSLPDTVGGMRFDRELLRWVKIGPAKRDTAITEDDGLVTFAEDSDDPFRSFESLESGGVVGVDVGNTTAEDAAAPSPENEEESDAHDENEDQSLQNGGQALTAVTTSHVNDDTDDSFDFDCDSNIAVVEVMTGVDSHGSDTTVTTDSEDDESLPNFPHSAAHSASEEDGAEDLTATLPHARTAPNSTIAFPDSYSTPVAIHRTSPVPPRSALKKGSGSLHHKTPGSIIQTPNNLFGSAHRRSVSFSDGRKDGKIKGLERNTKEEASAEDPSPILPVSANMASPFVPSARGNRIAAILEDLAEPSLEDQTPSKASASSYARTGTMQPLVPLAESQPTASSSRRLFARSTKEKELSLAQGNQTFLTECSFGASHDKLVHIITDIHPYIAYWEDLDHIDLSNKGIDSVVRLKEFLPLLDALKIEANALSWLTGIPKTLRTLSVGSNLLTAMTSFNHLLNLENLDISNNQIDSLQQLSCLRHLRELKADGNAITSLDGLGQLDGLIKLSLKGNCISQVDFSVLRLPRLELLNLSRNGLRSVAGLSSLSSLSALNLDHNHLVSLEADEPMPRLRTLRASNNRLIRLDASRFPNLRTLYADNNRLRALHGAQKLRKLENLSVRNQGGAGLTLATNDIRDVKRLYLSGNPLSSSFLEEPCYNLIYLEVAACRLIKLPHDLARLIPNVRVLNLNYNFLTDTRALDGLTRLRKLTLIGSRLKGTKSLVSMLKRMPEIEMLDFRMNPCTLGWYLPILVQDVPGALQPSEDIHSNDKLRQGRAGMEVGSAAPHSHPLSWQDLDAKFRRDLPDEAYVGRLAYRGLVMRACPKVKMLDGIIVGTREQEKAERLLQGVLGANAGT
ncbi:hypothetical protein K439DRAFT_1633331 [Ramaria rubella]|nr:hypothetical protein K439DRAFT_1633331 [Ramaria rubella]